LVGCECYQGFKGFLGFFNGRAVCKWNTHYDKVIRTRTNAYTYDITYQYKLNKPNYVCTCTLYRVTLINQLVSRMD